MSLSNEKLFNARTINIKVEMCRNIFCKETLKTKRTFVCIHLSTLNTKIFRHKLFALSSFSHIRTLNGFLTKLLIFLLFSTALQSYVFTSLSYFGLRSHHTKEKSLMRMRFCLMCASTDVQNSSYQSLATESKLCKITFVFRCCFIKIHKVRKIILCCKR